MLRTCTSISLAQLVCILPKQPGHHPHCISWVEATPFRLPPGTAPKMRYVCLEHTQHNTVRFNFHNYACKSAMFVGISLAFSFGILLRVTHTHTPRPLFPFFQPPPLAISSVNTSKMQNACFPTWIGHFSVCVNNANLYIYSVYVFSIMYPYGSARVCKMPCIH